MRLHHEIKKNINKYDRLILLCSRRSLIRKGVLNEIEEVFEREAAEGGTSIIIPISLDDVLFEMWWKYEPNETGEPVESSLNMYEIHRRENLAKTLKNRVAGDLKCSTPGDKKWNRAIRKIAEAL